MGASELRPCRQHESRKIGRRNPTGQVLEIIRLATGKAKGPVSENNGLLSHVACMLLHL